MKYAGIIAVFIMALSMIGTWHKDWCHGQSGTIYALTGQVKNPLVLTCPKSYFP